MRACWANDMRNGRASLNEPLSCAFEACAAGLPFAGSGTGSGQGVDWLPQCFIAVVRGSDHLIPFLSK